MPAHAVCRRQAASGKIASHGCRMAFGCGDSAASYMDFAGIFFAGLNSEHAVMGVFVRDKCAGAARIIETVGRPNNPVAAAFNK